MTIVSRSKGNQAMKYGQLIEFNMRNIFLENHTQNMVEKLFPDPFVKNQNRGYLWINSLKFNTVCFQCMPSSGLPKYFQAKLQTTCFYLIQRFSKKQKGLELASLPHFLLGFWKKNISLVIFYYLTKFHCLFGFTSWDIGQYMYCNCLLTRFWRNQFYN